MIESILTRRSFLERSALGLMGLPVLLGGCASAPGGSAPDRAPDPRRRLAVTSVCFREWFTQTRGWPGQSKAAATREMTLLDYPAFVAAEFGLHNIEVWSFQFADLSVEYCRRLRDAALRQGSQIVNVQLDLIGVDLASPDPAMRQDALRQTMAWMDRAAACGSLRMRANTNVPTPGRAFNVPLIADSFRQLADYGRSIGVMILVENHYGSAVIADAAAVVRAVDHPNCRALADWGNSAATSTAQRIADLSLLFPKLELVSAKGLHFDADYRHVDYDIGAIVRATEAAGFRGIYSIELWADQNPPDDPVRAAHTMLDTIAPLIINAAV